jgi:hypothetical protein
MIVRALLICAATITVAVGSACVPPPIPATPPGGPAATGPGITTRTCNNGMDFANSVTVLNGQFDPSKLAPPTVSTSPLGQATPAFQDFSDAFDAAPKKFQALLCNTSVYVDPFAVTAWGFRNPNMTSQRFIGLPTGYWGGPSLTNHSPPLSLVEGTLLYNAFTTAVGAWDPTQAAFPYFNTATSSGNNADTPGMAILAVLAHEYGHTLWFDDIARDKDPTPFCRAVASKKGDGFFDSSWSLPIYQPTNYWTPFGLVVGAHTTGLIQISTLQYDLSQIDYQSLAYDMAALYSNDMDRSRRKGNGLWADLFGAISPNEDFVETFKIAILTDNKGSMPITSMAINFNDPVAPATFKRDIYKDIASGKKLVLGNKINCVKL